MTTEVPSDLNSTIGQQTPRSASAEEPKNAQHARPPVTQLEFRQAMRDFRSMFPEMEAAVIEAVLRANGGAVDATIDQLLTMAQDNDNERLRTELEATENAAPPPSYQQATVGPIQSSENPSPVVDPAPRKSAPSRSSVQSSQGMSPARANESKKRNWKPAILGPLPPSFLRLEQNPTSHSSHGQHRRISSASSVSSATSRSQGRVESLGSEQQQQQVQGVSVLSTAMLQQRMEENERQRRLGATEELAQYLEDERIAILLQNEEFVRELRRNQEFMSTLDRDIKERTSERSGSLVPDDASEYSHQDDDDDVPQLPMDAFPYTRSTGEGGEDSDAAFKERLKNMGKASRRKFAQLARLFSRTKKCNFRQMLGDGANPSRDNLLLHEDNYGELSEEEQEGDTKKEETWNSHHVASRDGTSPKSDR
ncbi:CUE domain-containing protein 1-like isoform X2 [Ornithodoros turicata]|uniref:CUE domain-containing protein 1-like isoform X2 n=1 Tax=Ornithodoros turicata TaxID=34597 RepID=UPI00313942E3